MRLYLTHATSFDYKKELYQPIKTSLIGNNHILILPHEHSSSLASSQDLIPTLDYMLAEISYPSTGQGIELGWAHTNNVPIIAFYKNKPASRSVSFLTKQIFSYQNSKDLISKLSGLL